MKKDQLVRLFSEIRHMILIENDVNEKIISKLDTLEKSMELILDENQHKSQELNIHRGLEALHLLVKVLLGGP